VKFKPKLATLIFKHERTTNLLKPKHNGNRQQLWSWAHRWSRMSVQCVVPYSLPQIICRRLPRRHWSVPLSTATANARYAVQAPHVAQSMNAASRRCHHTHTQHNSSMTYVSRNSF